MEEQLVEMIMVFPKSKVRIEIELLYHRITRKRLAEVEVNFIMNGIVYMKCAFVFICLSFNFNRGDYLIADGCVFVAEYIEHIM